MNVFLLTKDQGRPSWESPSHDGVSVVTVVLDAGDDDGDDFAPGVVRVVLASPTKETKVPNKRRRRRGMANFDRSRNTEGRKQFKTFRGNDFFRVLLVAVFFGTKASIERREIPLSFLFSHFFLLLFPHLVSH